jgi:CBS domain-containing protein
MRIRDVARRSGIAVGLDRPIAEVAALMDAAGVGAVVVVDGTVPVGIVTDRDLVRRALAKGLAPDARVDGVMTSTVVTIDADVDAHDAYRLLREHAVRRLVITDGRGFVGVVTIDDLLVDLAADLADLVRPVTAELLFPHRDAPVPATT